jgi:hypothetical protein
VLKLRDRALDLGGTLLPPPTPKPASGPITRKEFEAALVSFGHAVSVMRRMAFHHRRRSVRRFSRNKLSPDPASESMDDGRPFSFPESSKSGLHCLQYRNAIKGALSLSGGIFGISLSEF